MASALSTALTILPMPDPSPSTLTVLNSNFLQLGKRRKRQKFTYRIFACKISCHQVLDLTTMTGNFTCESTISEFLPFSTFNCCHRYTTVKTTVFIVTDCTSSGTFRMYPKTLPIFTIILKHENSSLLNQSIKKFLRWPKLQAATIRTISLQSNS